MQKVKKKSTRGKNQGEHCIHKSKKKSKPEPIPANHLFPVERRKKQRKRIEKKPLI